MVCLQQLLLSGDSLRKIQFDQSRMHSHLIRCFEEKKLEEFPFSSCTDHLNRAMIAHRVIHLFCTCRMPENFNTKMVACDICEKMVSLQMHGHKKESKIDNMGL